MSGGEVAVPDDSEEPIEELHGRELAAVFVG
jgi:hypothetical protein